MSRGISFRQTALALAIAVVLGLLISLGQIGYEFFKTRERLDQTVHGVLRTLEAPAIEAAYNLNRRTAVSVVDGLFRFPSIHYAALYDNFGELLAERRRPVTDSAVTPMVSWIIPGDHEYALDLRSPEVDQVVGRLVVQADANAAAWGIIETSVLILVLGLVHNVLLAAILAFAFFLTLTKPLQRLWQTVKKISPAAWPQGAIILPGMQRRDEIGELANAVRSFMETARDHQRQSEQAQRRSQQENSERRRVEETLREREGRIRRLVESNIIGIFFWDMHGGISDANDAFLRLIGYSRDDLRSGKIRWMDLTPPGHRATDASKAAEVRKTGTCTPYEKEFLHKDGRRVPILLGAAMFEEPRETGVAFVLDLTERKQAEAEREARQVADAANRAKSEFLANISHELRTPLNGILGYAQILQRDLAMDERQLAGLNVIRQSGEHLLTLINDILDFAKMEAGKLALNPTDVPLAAFLRIIAEMISVKAEQKGLDFISDIAPDLPNAIHADEKRLRQVLLNLLSNAVKFTDSGQVTLRVRFSPPASLRFEVQDTGIGIGEEQLEVIFQPFEQAGEMPRRFGGTGLGLSISRQFVRLMGSEIRVESRVGQGSTFWFELDAPRAEAELVAVPLELVVTGYQGPRKKILVVDDVAENRAVVVDMLGSLGFEVVEAESGCDGLEKVHTLWPQLILMDRVMPEMDGLEATRRLRQHPAFHAVPIIVISASASGGDEQDSLAAGANAFLPKPINLGRLLAQIATLLSLDWIYEVPQVRPAAEPKALGRLPAPSEEEMEILRRLARLGNMRDILQRANYLSGLDERYRPFADQLRILAKGYQSKAILSLVEGTWPQDRHHEKEM